MDITAIKAVAVALVLALPRPWFPENKPRPETLEARDARVTMAIGELVDAADELHKRAGLQRIELIALSLDFAYSESAFAWEVHSGQPWPGRPSPFGPSGERCFMQLHRQASAVPFDEWRPFEAAQWKSLPGVDVESTRRCARAGVLAIAWGAKRCKKYLDKRRNVGDELWFAASIAAQYHRPRLKCGHIAEGSLARGRLYRRFAHGLRKAGVD